MTDQFHRVIGPRSLFTGRRDGGGCFGLSGLTTVRQHMASAYGSSLLPIPFAFSQTCGEQWYGGVSQFPGGKGDKSRASLT